MAQLVDQHGQDLDRILEGRRDEDVVVQPERRLVDKEVLTGDPPTTSGEPLDTRTTPGSGRPSSAKSGLKRSTARRSQLSRLWEDV